MFKKIAIATLFSAPVVYTQPIDSSFSERAKRPAKFWSKLLPVFLHYKSTQFYLNSIASKSQAEKDLVYEKLHEKYADQVLDLILDLRGIYIKIGQVGAMRADIFPETYRKRFQVLLDRVPSLDGDHAIKIVQEALGKDLTKVFSEFNENAIGAASIGQVHKAILLDGTHVVVKIKYPESHLLFYQRFCLSRTSISD